MENEHISSRDLSRADGDKAPPDPSSTSHIGQKVEQGVIKKDEGISEQSAEWEDEQESVIPQPLESENAEEYLKHPSPESMNKADKD